jgi:solute carrier family 45 protein 1/2/4
LLGFFFGPLLGCLSDRCKLSWGRRRPLLFALSVGLLIGLIFAPFGKDIAVSMFYVEEISEEDTELNATKTNDEFLSEETTSSIWIIILTIIGVVFLDFCVDNLQSPSRSYLLDMCDQQEHTKALTTFSMMTGFGGCLGRILKKLQTSVKLFRVTGKPIKKKKLN